LLAGAQRVEGTLLGNGERSGNVDIVTLALNLYSHGVDPGLVFPDMPALVRTIEQTTKLPVHPRHPYAGELVFTAFSGSHQDAIHKGQKAMEATDGRLYEVPYLPIDPADIGRGYEPVIRINSQSGKSGIAHVLERDYGLRLPRALAIDLSREVQARTDASGEEYSAEATLALFRSVYADAEGPLSFDGSGVQRQSDGASCTVTARLHHQGQPLEAHGTGAGPIEAFVNALSSALGTTLALGEYSEHALREGADARAVAYVSVRTPSAPQARFGVGQDEDVVLASFRAIVSAYNRAAR
jgi:2-isopropylmalate synthase